ncbi:alpha/beta fold hydrolase [Arthrobacter sp. NPDC056727]|uniref:alpha/beta fold hydrolase n=1 Tax=Arthrobacter sp. NPDC056727 TaxID=3345927 RepID=UPI00366AD532
MGYGDAPNLKVTLADGRTFAYREVGDPAGGPLLLLQHFRGNLDNWDPALADALANGRRVIAFDNAGVGGSDGVTPSTIDAMGLDHLDVLGFSIGSFLAQEFLVTVPDSLGRVVLASSAPRGAAGVHGWAPDVIGGVGTPNTTPEEYVEVFFAPSETSKTAGMQALGRMYARTEDRDAQGTRNHQYAAVCEWGIRS